MGSKGVPASGGSSCGSGPGLSSSGTVPAACCVSVSSSPSLPPLSVSPPHGQSPTRPAAAVCSASWAAPTSSAGSCPPPPPRRRRRRPPPPRYWKTRYCHPLQGRSAFCGSLSGCRRWRSHQSRSGPGPPARCPPPGSSESQTEIPMKRRRRMSLRHCRLGWRRVGRSAASLMRPPWFSALKRTFSACISSPWLHAEPEPSDIKQKTE